MIPRTPFVIRVRQMVSIHQDTSSTANPNKKRNYETTFGPREYEKERYGQEIIPGFFVICQGHAVDPSK